MPTASYSQTAWSLAGLFPSADGPEIEAAFTDLSAKVDVFEAERQHLTPAIDPADFRAVVRQLEAIHQMAYRLSSYAGLWFAADTQNQAAQSLRARVDQFMAEVRNRTLFFSLWWKALTDEAAERLLAGDVGDWRYWLEEMRHFRPHTLTEPEEKIINIKDVTGVSALQALYDSITNRYVFRLEVDGQVKEMTRGELMVNVRSPRPEVREAAYREQFRVYGQDGPILGQMYQTLVRDWRNENVDLRRFRSPIAVRNLNNDIPDDVVDSLLDVAKANASVFQRFFRLKAKLHGVERLRRYDIYAPFTAAEKSYSYEQAVDMVLDSFARFEPRIAQLAARVFDEGRIDSEVRKGKRSGAFCWSVTPQLTPWVLANYQGRANDVSTLAHELGHAIHTMLASHHSVFTFHASLPLAETASTFGEMLLVDRLLHDEPDEAVRRDLLFQQIDDAYATIQRQAFFALFERQAHEMVQANAAVDEISAAYLQTLRDQFGDAVEVADEFKWEWVAIPHIFHSPFYVYAYAFGQLLVLSLYRRYQSEGDAFKPKYLDILAAGGSDAPARILAAAGIDIHSREFWQGGFDIIAERVGQLEQAAIATSGHH
ncbi:MAG: M3 family oligoendopeptidase [Caldilineales bacterium]|nr:M3 family oligoendopeptidase [Caldilineales bacterium]MCW5860225.1 M3 family oligoendopeptidase [Caldilineales bacterium]